MSRHPTWRIRAADHEQVDDLARGLDLHPVLARVLVARGMGERAVAERHLNPRLADLTPPAGMAGMPEAVERLSRAVVDRERVAVFGDYDVDGISSAALVGDYLRRCDVPVTLRVARRDEGYGFGVSQARELVGQGCSLLVLTDCGTSDHEAVQAAAEAGADVVAVDHHKVTHDRWPGLALINPHRPDCAYPYKGLASVGLAFYLVASLRRALEAMGRRPPDPRDTLDLVALGTIADVAPLDRDNRILVHRGLAQLSATRRPGLQELLRLCKMSSAPLTSEAVGWRLGPRLNAPGRLGDAQVSLDCLWAHDEDLAVRSARQCDALNEQRRSIQATVQTEGMALARAQVDAGRSFILIAGEAWHPGVIGIVAGRLTSTFERPAAVVSLGGGEGKGSARSVPGLDLVRVLESCSAHLERFGGHAAAAGFSVRPGEVEALQDALDRETAPLLGDLPERVLEVDGELELRHIDLELCHELRRLGPHGCDNPEPVFVARGVPVAEARAVGREHLALVLGAGGGTVPAIGFGMASQMPGAGERVDLAFAVEVDDYRGPRARVRLIEMRRDGADEG